MVGEFGIDTKGWIVLAQVAWDGGALQLTVSVPPNTGNFKTRFWKGDVAQATPPEPLWATRPLSIQFTFRGVTRLEVVSRAGWYGLRDVGIYYVGHAYWDDTQRQFVDICEPFHEFDRTAVGFLLDGGSSLYVEALTCDVAMQFS